MSIAPLVSRRSDIQPDIALADRVFGELRARTSDGEGVTRMSYGPGESIAHAIVRREGEALGLQIRSDAACNLYLTLPSNEPGPQIIIGSHLDSVPKGGNFDGAAGVLMGLSVVSGLVRANMTPRQPITVMVIRAEESAWFGSSYIGSRAAFGRLPRSELETVRRTGDGELLVEAIRSAGGRPEALYDGRECLSPDDVGIFLEPHIEQGDVLIDENLPVGIVTDIRGSFRFRDAHCRGAYGHSGTTPYEARRDAVRAASTLVVELDRLWQDLKDQGENLTITVGQFATDPKEASFSKIAGLVRFSLDVRSNSAETLDRTAMRLEDLIESISAEQNVEFELGPRTGTAPAAMHRAVIERLALAADSLAIPSHRMPCGAGHDAVTFAEMGIPTGMLFVRNENGSHNPDEHMTMEDFALAASMIMEFCLEPPDVK